MIKCFLTFSLCLLITNVNSQPIHPKDSVLSDQNTITGWKTYNGSNFSIQYPPSWEFSTPANIGVSFVLLSHLENNFDKFRENVNLMIQDLSGREIDLNKFIELTEAQMKYYGTNSVFLENQRIKNSNNEFHKLVYTAVQGIFQLWTEQYIWMINEKAYVLTLSCEQAKSSDYKEIGEKILNSFIFKKRNNSNNIDTRVGSIFFKSIDANFISEK